MTSDEFAKKLALELSLAQVYSDEDYQKLSADIGNYDFAYVQKVMQDDYKHVKDDDVKTMARVFVYILQNVSRKITKQITEQTPQIIGGTILSQELGPVLANVINQLGVLSTTLNDNLVSRGRFLDLFYGVFLLDLAPGILVPNKVNGVDLYLIDFVRKDDGTVVWLDAKKEEIPASEYRAYAENLLYNVNPNTKPENKRQNCVGVKRKVEVKAPVVYSAEDDEILNKTLEFGWEQIARIMRGEFDVKDEFCFFYPKAKQQTMALALLTQTKDTRHLEKLSRILRYEFAMYQYLAQLKPGDKSTFNFTMERIDFSKTSAISSNRNQYKVKLWKLRGEGWYLKDFQNNWLGANSIMTTGAPARPWALKRVIKHEFGIIEPVLRQIFIGYIASEYNWWETKLLTVLRQTKRRKPKLISDLHGLIVSGTSEIKDWTFVNEADRALIYQNFTAVLDKWVAACAKGLGLRISLAEIKAVLKGNTELDLIPNGHYKSESEDAKNRRHNAELRGDAEAKLEAKRLK